MSTVWSRVMAPQGGRSGFWPAVGLGALIGALFMAALILFIELRGMKAVRAFCSLTPDQAAADPVPPLELGPVVLLPEEEGRSCQ